MRTGFHLRPLALAVGLLAATACASTVPTAAAPPEPASRGFSTQVFGGYGYGPDFGYPNAFGYPNDFGTLGCGPVPCGYGYGYGYNVPVAGDIYGGTTFWTGRRFDRQPASLPYGVAEENDEAYRPLGSAIWQRK